MALKEWLISSQLFHVSCLHAWPLPPGLGRLSLDGVWLDYREIPSGSSYKNSSKNRAKLSLVFLDLFSSAIMNELSVAFTSRVKLYAKCVYQQ